MFCLAPVLTANAIDLLPHAFLAFETAIGMMPKATCVTAQMAFHCVLRALSRIRIPTARTFTLSNGKPRCDPVTLL